MITKQALKEQIPYGMFKKVALKAGVSPAAVTRFFDGKTKSSSTIYRAALEVINEYHAEITPLEKTLTDLKPELIN